MSNHKQGALRVWWIPQIPGKPFFVNVASPQEGLKMMQVLADYDRFQFENRIKPDYSNVGGLECYSSTGGGWSEWYDPGTGDDIDSFRIQSALPDLDHVVPNDHNVDEHGTA